VHILLSRVQG